jgi:hypothetical protein
MNDSDNGLSELVAEQVRKNANERLQDAVFILQCAIYEIECYRLRLEKAASDQERAQLLNWALNFLVCNTMPNLRIDLLANTQAELCALPQAQPSICD